MSYIEHAKREFVAVGYKPLDQDQEDGPNKWFQENVLELLEVFDKQGHSGSSAPYVINMFNKLANFKPLCPIKGTDDEWNESLSGGTGFQNKRETGVFKDSKDDVPHYIHAISWKNDRGVSWNGTALTSKGEEISSSQFINLPFTPKTFTVDIREEEVKKDDWLFHIKDESQLEEVFKYYKKGYKKGKKK